MIIAVIELHKPILNTNPLRIQFPNKEVFDQWLVEPKNSDYIKHVVSVKEIKDAKVE